MSQVGGVEASTPNTPASTQEIICFGFLLYSTGSMIMLHTNFQQYTEPVVNIGNSNQDPSILPYTPFL